MVATCAAPAHTRLRNGRSGPQLHPGDSKGLICCVDALVEKLNVLFRSPIVTEERVVHALVGVRKLMEMREVSRDELKPVWFFCDWVVHGKLDRSRGWQNELLSRIDSIVERGISPIDLPDSDRRFLAERFSLDAVRTTLIRWLAEHGVHPLALAYTNGWYWFVRKYADAVADCPLKLRGGRLIKEITLKIVLGNAVGSRLDYEWSLIRRDSPQPVIWVMPTYFQQEGYGFGRNGPAVAARFDEELASLGFSMPWSEVGPVKA